MQARMRLQINFMLNGTKADPGGLFDHMQDDFVIPFVFVKRDSIMTDEQVQTILGDLITAGALKIPVLVVLVIISLILLISGACCWKKYRSSTSKDQNLGVLERATLIDDFNSSG